MPYPQMLSVMDNCAEMCGKFGREPYFCLTGGDPILHPDFWRLLSALKDRGYSFTIMGNPFHLGDAVCARLAELGCEKYQMSLDGMRETHDWFRKPGSFDATLEKLACIRKAGIETVIMTTVSDRNIAEIPELIDIVVDHFVDIYAFARFCPGTERGSNGISPAEYRALLDRCWQKFHAYEAQGCHTTFNRKDHLWTLYEYEAGRFRIPEDAEPGVIYDGCNCGNCHMTILPNGDLYACRRFNSWVGNALEDSIADVWTGPMEAYRNFSQFRKCGKCELLPFCRGCPAVAYGMAGNFYDADPQCWKDC